MLFSERLRSVFSRPGALRVALRILGTRLDHQLRALIQVLDDLDTEGSHSTIELIRMSGMLRNSIHSSGPI